MSFTVKFLDSSDNWLQVIIHKGHLFLWVGKRTCKLLEIRNSVSYFYVLEANLASSGELKNVAGNTGIQKITKQLSSHLVKNLRKLQIKNKIPESQRNKRKGYFPNNLNDFAAEIFVSFFDE